MSKRNKEREQSPIDEQLSEAGKKVGRALARSSFQAEQVGKQVKQKVRDSIARVTGKGKKSKSPFCEKGGIAVTETMGFVAGEIFDYLCGAGEMGTEQLVHALMHRQHSMAMLYCAIGWLAREGKVSFRDDGAMISLSDES